MRRHRPAIAGATSIAAVLAFAACGTSGNGDPAAPLPDATGDAGQPPPASGPDGAPRADAPSSSDAPGARDALVDTAQPPPPVGDGHVTFRLQDTHWHRIGAKPGAPLDDLTPPLDAVTPGTDSFLNLSKDGAWLISLGSRFGCASGACLALFTEDASKGAAITTGLEPLADARPAVASGGDVVVFAARGPHDVDLYATRRTGGAWGSPVLLTGASTFPYHHDVSVRFDGSSAVFDCGADPYGMPPTSICEATTDGATFRVLVSPSDGPDHSNAHATHHPDYSPEGDLVFEADWSSEQVWRLPAGTKTPIRVSPADETNDNSPCVLPDGRIASLWLGRQGNTAGYHELKVMNPDGSGSVMLLTGQDVVDIGLGCGN